MHCTDKNFGAKRPLVTTGDKLECFRLKDFPGSSGKKTQQSINSSTTFALTIIKAKAVSKELLSSANLTEAQALCIHRASEI